MTATNRWRTAGFATAFVVSAACSHGARDVESTLGSLTPLATPAPAASNTPSLAVRADGTLVLSWTERRADSSYAVRVAERRNGTWDSTQTISEARPYFANWADFPAVSVLNDGALAAHWLERDGNGKYAYGIRVVRSADRGRTWSSPVIPHTDALPAEHGFVALWPQGADGLGLAWLDGRKSAMPDSTREMTVRTAVIAPDGSLHDEAILDARSCDCCQVASAATAQGRVVVYRDRSPVEIRDIVVVRQTAGGWSAPVKVHDDQWYYPGCPVNGPSVATRGDTVMVAWFTAAHDTARVMFARSTDGGATFAAPVRVDDGNPMGRAFVVTDNAGDPIVAWMEHNTPETADLRVRRITGTTRSPAVTITTMSSARQSGFPRMVVVRDTLMVAWTSVKPSLQVQMAQLSLTSRAPR